jgi:hypothetical protein
MDIPDNHMNQTSDIKYLALEVGDGGDYDTKADIYSLGTIATDLFDIFPDDSYYF